MCKLKFDQMSCWTSKKARVNNCLNIQMHCIPTPLTAKLTRALSTKGFDRILVCTFLSYFLTRISDMLFVLAVDHGFSPLIGAVLLGYVIFLEFSSILTSLAQNLWQQDEIWRISNESIVQALHLYDMHHHAKAFWVVKIGCIIAGARFFTLFTQCGAYAWVSSI